MFEVNGIKFRTKEITIEVLEGSKLPEVWKNQTKREAIQAYRMYAAKNLSDTVKKETEERFQRMLEAGYDIRKEPEPTEKEKAQIQELLKEIDDLNERAFQITEEIKHMRDVFGYEMTGANKNTSDYNAKIEIYQKRIDFKKKVEEKEAEKKKLLAKIPALKKKIESIERNTAGYKLVPHVLLDGTIPLREDKLKEMGIPDNVMNGR